MAYGFLSINDWGDYQISDMYMNLSLRYKGTSPSLQTYWNFGIGGSATMPYGTVVVTAVGYTPILAIRTTSSTHTAFIAGMFRQPGTDNYFFDIYGYDSNNGGFITVEYYIFGPEITTDSAIPANTYGLQVFNSSGTIVYNSNNNHLSIVNAVSLTSPSAGYSTSSSTTLPAGRTYAYICQSAWSNAVYWQYAPGLSPPWFKYTFFPEVFLTNGPTPSITLNWRANSSQQNKTASDNNVFVTLRAVVIDVTGF